MITAGIDTETTGLEPGDHRIIEIYIGLYNNDGKKLRELELLVNPERSISADAQRAHGISIQDLAGKPTWKMIAPKVDAYLRHANAIVWHNGEHFDKAFLKMEQERAGFTLPAHPSLDTMLDGVWATPDGKKPSLEELAFACNVPYDAAQAHGAGYDVDLMMACFIKAQTWGFYKPVWNIAPAATPQPTA